MLIMRVLSKLIKKVGLIGMSMVLLLPSSSFAATNRFSDAYSRSSIVSEFDTGRIVYEKNADIKTSMASLSKMMTLLLTFDAIKQKKVSQNDLVEIIQSDVNRMGTHMNLLAGDKIPLRDLIDGMMIISANDATLAVARHVGGDYKTFVKNMNDKAKYIGMNNTVFYNPNGLPEEVSYEGKQYITENKTTARDVLKLATWLYEYYPNELIRITDKLRYVNSNKGINSENTNPLLAIVDDVDGLKTGFTDSAGYCLAYSMKINRGDGNEASGRLLGVSMGTTSKENRKIASYNTLNFISRNYKIRLLTRKDAKVISTKINGVGLLKTDLVAKKDLKVMKRVDEKLDYSIDYNMINIMKESNKPLAYHVVKDINGNVISKTELYSQKPFSEMSFLKRMMISMTSMFMQLRNIDSSELDYPVVTIF